jgi:hypothetical protein
MLTGIFDCLPTLAGRPAMWYTILVTDHVSVGGGGCHGKGRRESQARIPSPMQKANQTYPCHFPVRVSKEIFGLDAMNNPRKSISGDIVKDLFKCLSLKQIYLNSLEIVRLPDVKLENLF